MLRFGAEPKQGEGWPTWDGAERKQAVLSVAFRYLDTYRELLQEEGDRSNSFPKVQISTRAHTHASERKTLKVSRIQVLFHAGVYQCIHGNKTDSALPI